MRDGALDRAVDRVGDRCVRICGGMKEECFVNRREQINCIADMVINKTTVMSVALDSALKTGDREMIEKRIKASLKSASELANWIKYLQMVPDLRTLSSLVLDADSGEKRMEIRYPMPEDETGSLRVVLPGGGESSLVDFSQSGLGILSQAPLQAGAVVECRLTSDATGPRPEVFTAEARWCLPAGGGHACGMLIREVKGRASFNFFNMVNQFMLNIELEGL